MMMAIISPTGTKTIDMKTAPSDFSIIGASQRAARKPMITVGIAAMISTVGLIISRKRGRQNWLV